MKVKNFIIGIAVGLASLASLQSVFAATEVFSDVSASNPNYAAIIYLKNHGIISGYPDGTFKPNNVVNRAEALKIILEAAKISGQPATDSGSNANFKDVTDWNAWYYPYLNKATSLGIVSGYPDGTFKPNQTVNLVENLKMLIKAKNIDVSNILPYITYKDLDYSSWYVEYVNYAYEKNLLTPDAQNKVYPEQGMTRGKLAELVYRLLYIEENNLDSFSEPQSIQSITLNTGWYKVSMKAPTSWTVDTNTLTLIKGNDKFLFDPDYSPGEPANPNTQTSTVTTSSGKTLKITIITDKNNPSESALVYVEDSSEPTFYFSFDAPINDVNSEFYDIVKTISWEKI